MATKMSVLIVLFVASMLTLLAASKVPSTVVEAAQAPQSNQLLYGVTQGSLRPQDCGSRCSYRCSATSYKKPCMVYCQKCCAKCLCVPPGTYGNKQTCPCYNNWKTKRGGPKCP